MNCHQAPLSATTGVRENADVKGSSPIGTLYAAAYATWAAKTIALMIMIAKVTRIISHANRVLYYFLFRKMENKK
jgi:hypothetical protein